MMARRAVTDRAHRYRAQNAVTGPKRCVLCGSTRNLDVMHLDGHEENGEPSNLAYGCRSCNGKLAAAFKKLGKGRPTNQYNPAGKAPPTFAQYGWAVANHTRGEHDEGGSIIHATPKDLRIEYAQRIASVKRGHARSRDMERWNPSAAYKAAYDKSALAIQAFGVAQKAYRARQIGDTEFLKAKAVYKRAMDEYDAAFSREQSRGNPWPFSKPLSARQTTPATGGAAFHTSRKKADDLNRQFIDKPERLTSAGRYKGYTISKTPDGEFFSSLDRDSWFPTAAAARRHIDYVKKYNAARKNPSEGREFMTRAEALKRAQAVASTVPGATVRKHAWNITVVSRSGKHLVTYLGRKEGFVKANPAAAAADAFEEFHGHASKELVTVKRKVHHHSNLAAAGELRGMSIKPVSKVLPVRHIGGLGKALLCFNEAKNQLFIEGGDQYMSDAELKKFGITHPHELETLGKVVALDYFTNKTHLGDEGGEAVYAHQLRTTNEDGKHVVVSIARYPDLIYRVMDQQMEFSGGSYEIRAEGIDK